MIFFFGSYKSIIRQTLLFFFLAVFSFSAAAQTIYVKPSGDDANSGKSWASAFKTVTKALELANPGASIWVAAGTYYPTSSADRSVSFVLKDSVALFGGFNGTEDSL